MVSVHVTANTFLRVMDMRPYFLSAVLASASFASALQAADLSPAEMNRLLGRGINFGNCLEAPKEGEWGLKIEKEFAGKVKEAGFQSVRIPIRWSAHAAMKSPYEIDAAFFRRVDEVLEWTQTQQFPTIINIHHYEELYRDPAKEEARFLALWKQIAERYKDQPQQVVFEMLNEPHDKLTDERWNEILPKALAIIRESNPERIVIVGPGHWNNIDSLAKLVLPKDDRLIVTFHYYSPYEFTHQGAPWDPNAAKWVGKTWRGTDAELAALRKDFDKVTAWSKEQGRPMFLGEFGSFSKADMESRAAWTKAVAGEAQKRGFSWSYWEFGSGFGAYDPQKWSWRAELKQALLEK
jgi:endoglucanase